MAVPVLNIPTQELNKKPSPYLKVKNLQRWLDDLPTTNTDRSSFQVIEQLKKLNRSRYPANERLQLLDTLRPAVNELLVQLKQPLKNSKLPLPNKYLHHAESIQNILGEMATGYKCAVNDMILKDSKKETDAMLLREAIYNSIQYLARRLVENYLVYSPEPYDSWRELHQLYNYAVQNNINNLAVDDPYPDYTLPVAYTIDLVYKRILLLALAMPYHLMQNEAEELYAILGNWGNDCRISPAIENNIENEFVFDLANDLPPRYISADMDWQPINGRMLDIKSVRLRIDNQLQQLLQHHELDDKHSLAETQLRDMLLRLAQAYEANLTRQDERRLAGNRVKIAVGINAAHYYVSDKLAFSPEMDELKLDGKFNIEPSMFANAYKTALEKDRRHSHLDYEIYEWQQNNTSNTGSLLNCSLESDKQSIKVGELVAYRNSESRGNRYSIGLVRWLRFEKDTGSNIGVMNLSHTAIPVATKAVKGIGKGTDYFRALMIPKQVSLSQTRSIIVPATLYDVNSVLAINMKNRFFHVRLTKQCLATRSFTQYEFDVLDD